MVKTGVRLAGVVALVIAAVAAYTFFGRPTSSGTKEGEEKYSLVVEFTPALRGREATQVRVEVIIGSRKVYDEFTLRSPWIQVFDVPKGKTIELWASQEQGIDVSCAIHALSGQLMDSDLVHDRGMAECRWPKR